MKLINISICAIILITTGSSGVLKSYLNTPDHNCVACLCHATTGCYSLQNCANYSISYDYWITAGSPVLDSKTEVNQSSYMECMRDDNCIIHTIIGYMDNTGRADCVCDGIYDCRDMLSSHLYGENCVTSVMSKARESRYNNCAKLRNLTLIDSNIECIDIDI